MQRLFIISFCTALVLLPFNVLASTLVMVEQKGCEYCAVWNRDVGVIYDKTPEGIKAPLRRVDIHKPLPADLDFLTGLVFTPTFVLIDGNKEIGRIRGYPGEDFFWGMLQKMIEKLPDVKQTSAYNGAEKP